MESDGRPAARRRTVLGAGITGLLAAAGCSTRPARPRRAETRRAETRRSTPVRSAASPTGRPYRSSPTGRRVSAPELPRGGRTIFPRYRVVAYYGTAGTAALGVLGSRPPDEIAGTIEKVAAQFASPGRAVQPAMELIVTVADRRPGAGDGYHHSIGVDTARRYLQAARKHKMLLVLDIQPGHSHFLPLVEHWGGLLAEPDVGLALDSEWRMPSGRAPGHVIGHTSADEINKTTAWLADVVQQHDLPQKLVLLHQFTPSMIRHISKVERREGLALVQQLDGFGSRADKIARYDDLQRPRQFHLGFKLFYHADTGLMSPSSVLKLRPPPEYVSYQ